MVFGGGVSTPGTGELRLKRGYRKIWPILNVEFEHLQAVSNGKGRFLAMHVCVAPPKVDLQTKSMEQFT